VSGTQVASLQQLLREAADVYAEKARELLHAPAAPEDQIVLLKEAVIDINRYLLSSHTRTRINTSHTCIHVAMLCALVML
jgi:hypothetical protein